MRLSVDHPKAINKEGFNRDKGDTGDKNKIKGEAQNL
jgi:hypothetical protein